MIHQRTIATSSSLETEQVGQQLAATLEPGDVLLLVGDLAAGKTTFVRGLVRGLGGNPGEVSSPTFVIVQSYECTGGCSLHHVDCYRLDDDLNELRTIGLEEILDDPSGITAIEWPRTKISDLLSPSAPHPITVNITRTGDSARSIEIIES